MVRMLCRHCTALEIAIHHEIHNCETPSREWGARRPSVRRGGLRGAGGISTDARRAANIEWGFCPQKRAAVMPSGARRRQAQRPQLHPSVAACPALPAAAIIRTTQGDAIATPALTIG